MRFNRRDLVLAGIASGALLAAPGKLIAARPKTNVREGFADVPGGKVWWRMVGSGPRSPLLVLHGGPGAGHDYLEPLAALAEQRPVIFYDQLGCGRSDKPDRPELWHIERFVEEVDAVRASIGLPHVVLYGHSWGGFLAQEYMRSGKGASSVDGLVLASTSASTEQFSRGAQRLVAGLPGVDDAQRRRLEAVGQTESPEYKAIVEKFYDAYVVHMDSPPPYLLRTFENLPTSRNYAVMNGPNEFSVVGNLKTWDGSAGMRDILVPTLIIGGEWDEFTPDCFRTLHDGIKGSRLVVIPKARHLAMVEKPTEYNAALSQFLSRLA